VPAHLPLAADLGDLIFLLVVLGGGLIQWLANRNKKPDEQDPAPYQDPFPREEFPTRSGTEEPEPTWDELMEALGQKPGEVRPEQVAPPPAPPPPAPPPLPAAPPPLPATPAFTPAAAEEPLSDQVRLMLAAMESRPSSSAACAYELDPPAPATPATTPPRQFHNLTAVLRNRNELRRAIILQEILQPPLALR
jgi:hypothetical protein